MIVSMSPVLRARFGREGSQFPLGCVDELSHRKTPPWLEPFDAALKACDSEIASALPDLLSTVSQLFQLEARCRQK